MWALWYNDGGYGPGDHAGCGAGALELVTFFLEKNLLDVRGARLGVGVKLSNWDEAGNESDLRAAVSCSITCAPGI